MKAQNIRIFESGEILSRYLSLDFANVALNCYRNNNQLNVALSGGSSPMSFYRHLAKLSTEIDIHWENIHIFWVDERCVIPTSSESNFKMAKLLLIDKINIPLENVHRIHGELKPRLAVNKYSKEITDHFESKNITIPSFDWIFLGIGNDGHIGSIFPYSSVLNSKYPTVTHSKNPYNDMDRITMTLPLINNSKRVTFIALGSAKAQILEKICELERRSKKYPAIYVDPSNGILEWYIDVEAGKCIESAHLL